MKTFYVFGVIGLICLFLFLSTDAYAQQRGRNVQVGGGAASGILGALLCGFIASTKGRNPWGWALFGFLCCPLALVILLLSAPMSSTD